MDDPDKDLPRIMFSPEGDIRTELTNKALSISSASEWVKSSKAGAVVIFAGTTRDNFNSRPVKHLHYTSYARKAIKTLYAIAFTIKQRPKQKGGDMVGAEQAAKGTEEGITKISISHRLGLVPIGEESIVIAVSAPHRHAAWKAGEEALEECKAKVEIWKWEEFEDGDENEDENENKGGEDKEKGTWRAN